MDEDKKPKNPYDEILEDFKRREERDMWMYKSKWFGPFCVAVICVGVVWLANS